MAPKSPAERRPTKNRVALNAERKAKEKDSIFTTGEVTYLCHVSQQTIIRCFENGSLKGFRIPGSRFRRIPWKHLYAFMKENNIPTDAMEGTKHVVGRTREEIAELLGQESEFEYAECSDSFALGAEAKKHGAQFVILDGEVVPREELKGIARSIGTSEELDAKSIVIASEQQMETFEDLADSVIVDTDLDETIKQLQKLLKYD